MARRRRKPNEPQGYDNTLKALFGRYVDKIIPRLLPGIDTFEEQNVELNRSSLRADQVFMVTYKGEKHIVNLELQTDGTIELRLLQYHVGFLAKYEVPVISIVLYPFRTTVADPPYIERNADGEILRFHYHKICLWEMEAQLLIDEHFIWLYTLLPAMKGATADLLKRALKELKSELGNREFGEALVTFVQFAERSSTLSLEDLKVLEEEVRMRYNYIWYIDENPHVIERVEKAREEALKEGETEGEVKGLQRSALMIIGKRFAALKWEAKQAIKRTKDIERLQEFILTLLAIETEQELRQHLLILWPEMEEELRKRAENNRSSNGNAHVLQHTARAREEARKEGVIEGEAQGLQQSALMIIGKRFAALEQEARPIVEQIQDSGRLKQLILSLLALENEQELRQLLQNL